MTITAVGGVVLVASWLSVAPPHRAAVDEPRLLAPAMAWPRWRPSPPAEPTPVKAEVLSADVLPARQKTALSEDSVTRILEIVWRDTRMLARTAQQRPLPVVWALATDRLPLVQWFASYKVDQWALALNEQVAALKLSPRSSSDLARDRVRLQRQLEARRADLWPTIRALLLRPMMHERIVYAARAQMLDYCAASAAEKGAAPLDTAAIALSSRLTRMQLLSSPQRIMKLWLGTMKALSYALKWLLNEVGLVWLLTPRQRQAARTRLIERAIDKGLELQRRVEYIEDARRAQGGVRALALSGGAALNATASFAPFRAVDNALRIGGNTQRLGRPVLDAAVESRAGSSSAGRRPARRRAGGLLGWWRGRGTRWRGRRGADDRVRSVS